MKLIQTIVIAAISSLSLAQATEVQTPNEQGMLASMAGTWKASCYQLPNGKYAARQVILETDGSVIGDMTIYKDAACTKELKKVHKEYSMKMGKKTVGDDGEVAYEVDKVGKTGWKVYTMIRMVSPTIIMPADKTKARDGSTPELRMNHYTAKTVQCIKK